MVDDCSTDGQWELLNKLYSNEPKVKLVRNEKNLGSFRCRNNAILKSNGRYVLPLDSDDIIYENALEILSHQFDDGVEVVQFWAKCELPEHERYFNMDVQTFDSSYDMMIYAYQNGKNHNLITKCFAGGMLRNMVRQFDSNLRVNIMYDDEITLISLSCFNKRGKVKVISDVLYQYSTSGGSNTFNTYQRSDLENDRNCLKIISGFIDKLDTDEKKVNLMSNIIESIV